MDLRQPAWSLLLYAVSVVIAVGIVVVATSSGGPVWFLAFFVLVGLGITAYNGATAFSRTRALADGSLVVRNRFTTRRLQRSDVDRVIVGRQGGFGSARRLELLLTDGTTLHLTATELPPLPGSRRRSEEQAEQLRAWVAGTPIPFR